MILNGDEAMTTPASGSVFTIGTTTVTASVIDAVGNRERRTFSATALGAVLSAPTGPSATAVDGNLSLGPAGRIWKASVSCHE